MIRQDWLLTIIILMAASALRADVVELRDGRQLEGELTKTSQGWVLTTTDGIKTTLSTDQIKRIEIKPRSGESVQVQVIQSRLDSLQRSVDAQSDAATVVQRYQDFIRQYGDTPVGESAREQLTLWQSRLDQKLVKQADQWVTREQAAQMRRQAGLLSQQARELLVNNQMTQASAAVESALKLEPADALALYLKGVLVYRGDDLNGARRAWDGVIQALPAHGPTLNNLAVIAWRQNRLTEALTFYRQALDALPVNETIIANCAEAINSLSDDQLQTPLAQRLFQRYVEQDQQLSRVMAEKNLYKWGSRYITNQEKAQIDAQKKEIEEQLNDMADRFNRVEADIQQMGLTIERNTRTLRQIESDSWRRDEEGRLFRLSLPPVYYEIQRENNRLSSLQKQAKNELQRLQTQAHDARRQLPQPPFTGVQQIMGAESAPVVNPQINPILVTPAPTTTQPVITDSVPTSQPTTAPAEGAEPIQIKIGPATQPASPAAP